MDPRSIYLFLFVHFLKCDSISANVYLVCSNNPTIIREAEKPVKERLWKSISYIILFRGTHQLFHSPFNFWFRNATGT